MRRGGAGTDTKEQSLANVEDISKSVPVQPGLERLAPALERREIESMVPKPAFDFTKLSFTERLQLVEDLWDSLDDDQDAIPVPDWHLEEIERRLKAYRDDPEAGAPWGEVRERILKHEA